MSKDKKAPQSVPSPADMKPNKELVLPNKTMALLYGLLNVPLHGSQSRARNRFAQIIKDRVNFLEDQRIKLLEERCNKDEAGNPKKKNLGTAQEEYDIEVAPLAEYREIYSKLMDESFVIDLVGTLKADVIAVRPIVLESRMPIGTLDGYVYELICTAFEAV